ncbi:MAG: YihA family ribosome biogenesis GTP-binding protein [Flavobacteriales bacterium]|nr:YihA family ribosome biogenesis GTP-binding protein [Flavobacteriales bacterium]
MKIITATFFKSSAEASKCPKPDKPEYAFIGRSNVGKSSLINMMTNKKALAKISGRPGKTQLINHFTINEEWYMVDLPGYGYAKVSKKDKEKWVGFTNEYLLDRKNLMTLFVLIDSRHEPQKIDLEFMEWLATNQIPFSIIFTKMDKLTDNIFKKNMEMYKNRLLQDWEELPQRFFTSSSHRIGAEEILTYIGSTNELFVEP